VARRRRRRRGRRRWGDASVHRSSDRGPRSGPGESKVDGARGGRCVDLLLGRGVSDV
jgi:hypothetical protein